MTVLGGQQLDSVLHFRKSQHYNIYFLSHHVMTLGGLTQAFHLRRGKGFTRKEAYNMLCGRAVYKKQMPESNPEYFSWSLLNFNKPSEYGLRSGGSMISTASTFSGHFV